MATLSTARPAGNPALALRPADPAVRRRAAPRRSRSLAHELVESIGARIQSQQLKPGDKLPTESEIMRAFGVSRTVVREALSQHAGAGLVETRHGIGTFVLEPRPGQRLRHRPERTSRRPWT